MVEGVLQEVYIQETFIRGLGIGNRGWWSVHIRMKGT